MNHDGLPTQTTSSNSLKPPVIVAALFIIAVASGIGGWLLGPSTKQPISPAQFPPPAKVVLTEKPSVTTQLFPTISSSTDPTANWKTLRNDIYGFEVKYPPSYEVRGNAPEGSGGQYNPTFVPKGASAYAPPGLDLDFEPIPGADLERFKVAASRFDIQNSDINGSIHIILMDAQGKVMMNRRGQLLYAICSAYWDTELIDTCNTIISTIQINGPD